MSPEIEAAERGLVGRILLGDQAASNQLYEAHRVQVRRITFHMVGPDDFEDVAQDAWMNVFRLLPKFNHRSLLRTWITRAAINTSINFYRRRKCADKHIEFSIDDPTQDHALERRGDTTAELVLQLDLEHALPKLRPALQAVLLAQSEGLSLEETADALGKTVSAVKAARLRARAEMRRRICA